MPESIALFVTLYNVWCSVNYGMESNIHSSSGNFKRLHHNWMVLKPSTEEQ